MLWDSSFPPMSTNFCWAFNLTLGPQRWDSDRTPGELRLGGKRSGSIYSLFQQTLKYLPCARCCCGHTRGTKQWQTFSFMHLHCRGGNTINITEKVWKEDEVQRGAGVLGRFVREGLGGETVPPDLFSHLSMRGNDCTCLRVLMRVKWNHV